MINMNRGNHLPLRIDNPPVGRLAASQKVTP